MSPNWKHLDLVRLLLYFYCVCVTLLLINGKQKQTDIFQIFDDLNMKINRTTDGNDYFYTSYQRGIECYAALPPIRPKSIRELEKIVRHALRNNLRVKAVGNLHSSTDCICTDGLVVEMGGINHFYIDPRTNHSTGGAGLELLEFMENLHKNDRALTGAPAYGGVTLGGTIGTGAHGTNLKLPSTLSDQLVSVTFVDGMGNIRKISEGEEDFKAFKVHLGLLGIIYELTFRTTEQYKLKVRNYPVSDEILWTSDQEILGLAEDNDFFQFFWFPTNREVVMLVGNQVPVSASGNCQYHLTPDSPPLVTNGVAMTLEMMQATEDDVGYFFVQSYAKIGSFKKIPGRIPIYSEGGSHVSRCLPIAIGFSHQMMTNVCKQCPWNQGELSLFVEDPAIAIDVAELPRALKTLKDIFDEYLVGFPLVGIFFRFLKESDSYLGISSDRPSVVIEWLTVPRRNRTQPRLGITAFQAIGQALIERHGGRAHWGKHGLYYTSPHILQRAYPNLRKFAEVMERMDPHELFMNDLGKRIKYGRNEMTLSREAQQRCALNEACVCTQNWDCGGGEPLDYVCDKFMEFKVCKKIPSPLEALKELVSRNAIYLAAGMVNNVDYVLGVLAPYNGFGFNV